MIKIKPNKHLPILIIGFVLLAVLLTCVHEIVRYFRGKPIHLIDWTSSLMVFLASVYISVYVIGQKQFSAEISKTIQITSGKKTKLFVVFIPMAMGCGCIAHIMTQFQFIVGMSLYLLMHLCIIFAYAHIISLHPTDLFKHKKLYVIIALSWILMIVILYILLVFNDADSLIVIPYLVSLSAMAITSSLGIIDKQRLLMFRIVPVAAAALFVASDVLIGYMVFKIKDLNFQHKYAISFSYLFAILLYSFSPLFLLKKTKL